MAEEEAIRRLRHDLANPLAALLAETQLLLMDAADLPPDVVNGLKEIEALARRMREILNTSRSGS
ncbi:MAG TPA: histidine kinase dimerization/phospho-acceptor domain-containing protein [Gemmatimonadales bacterium]|nr:histidine kinase dimerization/phospho-acceptor domain-containing protein [Gemmatimonadales bacterium]